MPPSEIRRRQAVTIILTLISAGACAPSAGPGPAELPVAPQAAVSSSWPPGTPDTTATAAAARASIQVVRRYYAALDGLRRRMRTAALARVLAPDCPCRAQLAAVRAAIRRRERYTDRVRIISLLAHVDRPDVVDVVVSVDVAHGGLVDELGRRLSPPTTAHNVHREFLVRELGGRWLIGQVLAV